MKKKKLFFIIAVILLAIFVIAMLIHYSKDYGDYYNDLASSSSDISEGTLSGDTLKVRYIDVDQGDSELIIFPGGKTMLIDTGEYYAKDAVLDAIEKEGLTHIDAIVETHPHSDHMGCMARIIDEVDFDTIYMPNATNNSKSFEKLLDVVEKKNMKAVETKAGTKIDLDSNVKIEVLAPNSYEYENTNNYSVVIRLTYGDVSLLFMGDAEKLSEKEILKRGADVSADVIKLGHHGSSTSSGKDFIKAVNPSVAIASCGKDNKFGHPHKETVELMGEMGIKLLRTYETGDIVLRTDGKKIAFENGLELNTKPQNNKEVSSQANETKAPKTYVYVSKGGKYHLKSCKHYDKKYTKMTKEEAVEKGYEPCKNCKP